MSIKALAFRRAWVLDPSKEMIVEHEIMEAYAKAYHKAELEKELINFHKFQQNMWSSPNAEITENVVNTYLKLKQ